MAWRKWKQEQIKQRVFDALSLNIEYSESPVLGVPASFLDEKVFNQDVAFLKDAPFISTLVQNPNHIGCHTLGSSEPFFRGTQELEKDLLEICAVDILKAEPGQYDGYVASGGTEANVQAIWIYRNYFLQEMGAKLNEIAIFCSMDSHYSMQKASNLLCLDIYWVPVQEDDRQMSVPMMTQTLRKARAQGVKYFIVVCNMMTTMFGSVDDVDTMVEVLRSEDVIFRLHIDGAYGGFYYPFASENEGLTFGNPYISSFTLDAHKMAQAPYGTGIFLIRKNLIHHVNTSGARYVKGQDYTLIGSRSGANAVATWMILVKNGPYGWKEKIFILQKRTDWLCQQLSRMSLSFFRCPESNIVTIKAHQVSEGVAQKFGLVPDDHDQAQWYKLVIMEHVTIEKLLELVEAL